MRISQSLLAVVAFALAGALALLAALWAVFVIENRTSTAIGALLTEAGLDWATVEADGLQARLTGTAPTEATRFRALTLAGTVIDAARVRDRMEVTPATAIVAPRFSIEVLRNDDGITLIGLVPATTERDRLIAEIEALANDALVTDMLETADNEAPEGWDAALNYGFAAVKSLPRSKVSISAVRVAITAISGSEDEKRKLEADLARKRPKDLAVVVNISAPRPVITPFTLRFVIDENGARFDACSADTERSRAEILQAAVAAGAQGKIECTIGLGVPSQKWAAASAAGIAAVAELGGGTITFSDADVSLVATETTPQATFDHVVGELKAHLPEVFSLAATLPEKPATSTLAQGPAEFIATLASEGAVELRGRLNDETISAAVESYARAHFGVSQVYAATRLDPELPDGWPMRVLAGLEALAELVEGTLLVRDDIVEVTGVSASPEAQANIARILSDKLGQGKTFRVSVRYDEQLDPLAALPTPEECVTQLNATMASNKISFAPGSAEIDLSARATLDTLAENMRECSDVRIEIGGHTDSQGSEGGNLALSQARAEAVLVGLQGRRVLVGSVSAKGYGESVPIADNATEEGREANRRIEFRLIAPEDEAQSQDAVEASGTEAETAQIETPLETPETVAPVDEGSGDGEAGNEVSGDAGDDASAATTDTATTEPAADATPAANEEAYISSAPTKKTLRPQPRPKTK